MTGKQSILSGNISAAARLFAAAAMLLSLLVLAGWMLGIETLHSIRPDWPHMVPNTAVGIMLCSISALLCSRPEGPGLAGRVPSALAALLGLLAVVEILGNFETSVDTLLSGIIAPPVPAAAELRMSWVSALNLILVGTSLSLHGLRRWHAATELMLHLAGLLALQNFFSYLFGVSSYSLFGGLKAMSVPASLACIALYAAALASRGRRGLLGLLFSPLTGGTFLRALLPVALLVPYINSLLRVRGQSLGLFSHEEGALLMSTVNAFGVATVIVWTAVVLNREDRIKRGRERELALSESRLRRIFDSPLLGIFYWNLDGSITSANDKFLSMIDYTREAASSGKLNWATLTPREYDELDASKGQEIVDNGVISPYEKEFFRRDGSRLPVLIGGAILEPAADSGVAFVLDVTEQRRTRELLEQRNAELDSFSYSVSHDLRAPLRAIEGFSRALEEDHAPQLDEEARRYISRIRAGAVRMAQLIDDLLQLSRISRASMSLGPVNLSELAQLVGMQLAENNPERSVEWVVQPDLKTTGDARLLRIALENLIGNALKFTEHSSNARIEFGLRETERGPAYIIRDNGAGFDMAYVDRLFTAFQRLHSEAEFRGTGIGLATVRRIISRHNGQVWAEGRPGEGASFYFMLPEREVNVDE